MNTGSLPDGAPVVGDANETIKKDMDCQTGAEEGHSESSDDKDRTVESPATKVGGRVSVEEQQYGVDTENGQSDGAVDSDGGDDDGDEPSKAGKSRGNLPVDEDVPMTFPQRLMEILSNEDHADIISWLPHGRGFMIYQKKRFGTDIMPNYFKKSKFTSFTRKLNRWNFSRVTRGPETGAYYHEFFQRGNLRLCMQMCCQSVKPQPPQPQIVHRMNPMMPLGMNPGLNVSAAMSRLQLNSQDNVAQESALHGILGGNNASQLSHFADESIIRLRQLEQQRQELLMRQDQQQKLAALAGLNGHQQQNFLSPLGVNASFQALNPGTSAPSASPSVGGGDGNNAYSSAVVNAAINAWQRSNNTGYLSMLMSQEKLQAQMEALGSNLSPMDFQLQQANFLQAQQQQFDHFTQQRMLQAAASQAAAQQQQVQCLQNTRMMGENSHNLQGQTTGDSNRGKVKRASAA